MHKLCIPSDFTEWVGYWEGIATKEIDKRTETERGAAVCVLVFFLHCANVRKAHKALHGHLTEGDIRYDNDNISQRERAKSAAIEKFFSQPIALNTHTLFV